MRFFFDIQTPDAVLSDLIGDVLADTESALEEARKTACELACDALRGDGAAIPLDVLVRDEWGVAVGSVNVLHAVTSALVGKAKGCRFLSANDWAWHATSETRLRQSLTIQRGAS